MVRWWGGSKNPRNQEKMTGIYCPDCYSRLNEVYETRNIGDRIRRRRRCIHCGTKFMTYEEIEIDRKA